MAERFIPKLKSKIEDLFTVRHFNLDATVLAMGNMAPSVIPGTIYSSSDFVDEKSIKHSSWDGEKFLGIDTWRMERERYVTELLELRQKNIDGPNDIVLIINASFDPDYLPSIAPYVRAVITKTGLLSHMAIVTREFLQREEMHMESLVVLTCAKRNKLKRGDSVEINIQEDGTALIKVDCSKRRVQKI